MHIIDSQAAMLESATKIVRLIESGAVEEATAACLADANCIGQLRPDLANGSVKVLKSKTTFEPNRINRIMCE